MEHLCKAVTAISMLPTRTMLEVLKWVETGVKCRKRLFENGLDEAKEAFGDALDEVENKLDNDIAVVAVKIVLFPIALPPIAMLALLTMALKHKRKALNRFRRLLKGLGKQQEITLEAIFNG